MTSIEIKMSRTKLKEIAGAVANPDDPRDVDFPDGATLTIGTEMCDADLVYLILDDGKDDDDA